MKHPGNKRTQNITNLSKLPRVKSFGDSITHMSEYNNFDYARAYGRLEKDFKYNERYKYNPRESDVILHKYIDFCSNFILNLFNESIEGKNETISVLDAGCGNGNLLYNLKLRYPEWKLFGFDLSEELILLNKMNHDLTSIDFQNGSILDSGFLEAIHPGFDLIIVNAVLQTLPFKEYKLALRNISRLLNPGGFIIIFEGFFDSELVDSITCNFLYSQHSNEYLNEMQYTYVSYKAASNEIKKEGFSSVFFTPFNVSVNLHREKANPRKTFTLRLENGSNLSMLEIISQPWCFLVAQKLHTINLPSVSKVRDEISLQNLFGTNYLL